MKFLVIFLGLFFIQTSCFSCDGDWPSFEGSEAQDFVENGFSQNGFFFQIKRKKDIDYKKFTDDIMAYSPTEYTIKIFQNEEITENLSLYTLRFDCDHFSSSVDFYVKSEKRLKTFLKENQNFSVRSVVNGEDSTESQRLVPNPAHPMPSPCFVHRINKANILEIHRNAYEYPITDFLEEARDTPYLYAEELDNLVVFEDDTLLETNCTEFKGSGFIDFKGLGRCMILYIPGVLKLRFNSLDGSNPSQNEKEYFLCRSTNIDSAKSNLNPLYPIDIFLNMFLYQLNEDAQPLYDDLNKTIIVGAPRSGTTLLTSIVCSPDSYPMYEECWDIRKYICDWEEISTNPTLAFFSNFATDLSQLKRSLKLKIDLIISKLIHDQDKKTYITLKDPGLSLHPEGISDLFERNIKIIFIARNPIAIISSLNEVKIRMGEGQRVLPMCHHVLAFLKKIGPFHKRFNPNFFLTFYEKIVSESEESFLDLDAFVGYRVNRNAYENLSDQMVEAVKNKSETDHFYSENYGNTIQTTSVERYKKHLSHEQVIQCCTILLDWINNAESEKLSFLKKMIFESLYFSLGEELRAINGTQD